MKLARFFEKFDQLADAPNAVVKMRELVLRMATSGRIAEQDSSDQPASELLTEIFAIRDGLIKRGAARSRVEGNMIVAGDTIDIPATWSRCMISEVCDLQTGATPSRQESTYFGGDTPWLVSGDINKGEIFECDGRITEAGLKNSNCKIIPQHSVLIALNGQGKTRATVAILRIEAALNQSLVAMIPYSRELLLPEYLFWNLRGRYFSIRDITGQDQRRGLNMKLVGQLSLPIPPLAEQKRIVAKVDELMALCDRLEAQQQERDTRHAALARASLARFAEAPTPANLDFLFHNSYTITPADLRKSIFSLAVQGKLVEQDPNDEPAVDCLSRLGLRSTIAVTNSADVFDDSAPPSWIRVRFEDIAIVAGGVTLGRKLGARETVTLPYLRVANVKRGEIDLSVIKDVSIAEDEIERYALRENDLLMTEGGDWDKVGRAAIWKAQIPLCLHQNHIFRARMRSVEITPVWFERYFNSPDGRGYFESASKQTTNLASINMRQVRGCPVPFPPLAEQRRIVAKVDQLMALVDRLEVQLFEAKAKSAVLLDAIIHELLNPPAEVIDLASYRAAIGCYAIGKMKSKRYFGRTTAMKVFYLAQAHVGLKLDLQPMREAAGPLDSWIYRFEEEGVREDWFKAVPLSTADGKTKIEYRPGRALAEKSAQAQRIFTPDQLMEFDRLLALFADRTTEEAEIIATLFAAWNDFLIDGHMPSDDEIVTEVREHWHEKKGRFSPTQLRQWLDWLRRNNLVPQGRLPHTVHQPQLSLN